VRVSSDIACWSCTTGLRKSSILPFALAGFVYCPKSRKGGLGCLMSHSWQESQGCHLSPFSYLSIYLTSLVFLPSALVSLFISICLASLVFLPSALVPLSCFYATGPFSSPFFQTTQQQQQQQQIVQRYALFGMSLVEHLGACCYMTLVLAIVHLYNVGLGKGNYFSPFLQKSFISYR